MSPRILVVYVTAGAGHRRAAQALACALTAAFPHGAIECQDLLGHVPRWLQHTYPSVYDAFVRYLSPLWGAIFSSLDRLPVYACLQPLRRRWNWRMARGWVRRLQDDPPDCLVATHFFPADVISQAKRRGILRIPLLVVITDLHPHRVWLSEEAEAYVVGAEETAQVAQQRGIPAAQLHPLGIPVAEAFAHPADRLALLAQMGLDPQRRTVLVTGGGTTVGPFEAVVRALVRLEETWPGRLQVVAVCGENAHARRRLEHLARRVTMPVRVLGFIDTMADLMGGCDVAVTKAGGLIVTEALSRELPLIFYHTIPGQERFNARYVVRRGAGILAPQTRLVPSAVRELLEDPTRLARMREAARALARPHAAQAIVAEVIRPLIESARSRKVG